MKQKDTEEQMRRYEKEQKTQIISKHDILF